MSSITLSSLRLATALFLLFASGRLSTASLQIYQVEFIQDSQDDMFLVEALATITIGGSAPRHFAFNCISTSTNGEDISWARADGVDSFSQHLIPNGVQLDLANAQASDLTVYICYDGDTSASVKINVTDANPVASPVEEDGVIEAFLGEEVVIEFYAAGLPPPSPDDISWFYNFSSNITWGILSDDKRSMTIPNIQLSHAGEYKFRVLVWIFASVTQSTTATATVKVIVPPSIETHPVSVANYEWNQVNMTCYIVGTPPLAVEWKRVDGASLPATATPMEPVEIGTNMVKATLVFTELHVSDEGSYYCNVSLQDYPAKHNSSQPAQLTVNAKIRLEYQPDDGPAKEISNLHFVNGNNNVSFFFNCFGSGNLWWTSPTGDNVSLIPSDNPNQQTTDTLSRTLSFQSWSEELNGPYTCSSDLDGATESVTITNSNPAVVAEDVNVRVALHQNATLRVYVAGDPQPGADNIEWYKNGTPIVTSSSYSFMSDRQSLMIAVTGKDAAGIYECRVITSEGTSSAFINVTFPDPPEVIVIPPVSNVLVGNSSSFTCNVTSSLEYTLSWCFNGSPQLPEGVMAEDTVLVIPSAQPSHFGTYTCQADDQVNVRSSEAMLIVDYSPEAMVGLTEQDKEPEFSHTTKGGDIPPSFSCFYSGYPSPNVTWTLSNGEPLPSSMKQIHAKPGVLQLQFTSALAYGDPVSFVCSASNPLGTTTAKLELVIVAPPVVFTIVPTFPVIRNTSSPVSFAVPPSHTGSTLSCLAWGQPTPVIKWLDQNGQALTNYQECESGVVSAPLTLGSNFDLGPVQCVVTNDHGEEIKTVQLYQGVAETPTLSLSSPSETNGSTMVSFALRVLTSQCLLFDQSTTQLNEELQKIIIYTISISNSLCQSLPSSFITITKSYCSSEVAGATVFSGTINTTDASKTQQLYTAVRNWYQSDPALFLSGVPYALDLECDLLMPTGSQSECQVDTSTTTSGPVTTSVGPAEDQTILIIIFIATGLGLVLIVIVIVFIVVCIFTCHKSKEGHFITENWPTGETDSPVTSSWKHSSNSSALTAETYLMNDMEHSPEYDLPFTVRESLRRISSLNMEVNGNSIIPKPYPRQLPTASRDEIEAPSPQGLSAPSFQVSFSTVDHPNAHPSASSCASVNGDHKQRMFSSQEELPEEEQLYQPLASSDKVDHDYAQIIERPPQDHKRIPTAVGGVGVQGCRRATIGGSYPVHHSTRQSSSNSYEDVAVAPKVTVPRIPLNRGAGSTPVLVRVQTHAPSSTQPYSQASVFVAPTSTAAQPYQLPVSSQHSLANLVLEDPVQKSTETSTHDAGREVRKPGKQAGRLKSNHVVPVEEASSPYSLDEAPPQPWYKGDEADSVPPTVQPHEISPYAVTPNCEIQPNPYQEPCGSQTSFKTVQV